MSKRARAQQRKAPKLLRRTGPRYTLEEKLSAVTILVECGGLTVEGINHARELLNSNTSLDTLNKWLHQYKAQVINASNALVPIPLDVAATVETTRIQLAEKLTKILDKSLDRAEQTVENAGYRDVMVGSGIALDKLRVMSSLTSSVEAKLKALAQECRTRHTTLDDLLDDVLNALRQQPPAIESSHDISIE